MKHLSIFLCFTLVFTMFLGGNVFAKDIEGYPTIPSFSEYKNADFYIFKGPLDLGGMTSALVVFSNNDIDPVANIIISNNGYNDRVHILSNQDCQYVRYTLNSTKDNWIMDGGVKNVSANNQTSSITLLGEFVYADHDVYRDNGSLVFQQTPAPPQTLEEIIQVGVKEVKEKTTGTMKTIALCGVGCLALLIGFLLLPKVLYKYL